MAGGVSDWGSLACSTTSACIFSTIRHRRMSGQNAPARGAACRRLAYPPGPGAGVAIGVGVSVSVSTGVAGSVGVGVPLGFGVGSGVSAGVVAAAAVGAAQSPALGGFLPASNGSSRPAHLTVTTLPGFSKFFGGRFR